MTTINEIRCTALEAARFYYSQDNNRSWSECMQMGWALARRKMQAKAIIVKGDCEITYEKISNGEIAERKGAAITANNYQFKGSDKKRSLLNVAYFDKEAGAIRSFHIAKLIEIKEAV